MNKQKVKVIRKVAEELWASKSSGYKKVQLDTKKSMSLQALSSFQFCQNEVKYGKENPLKSSKNYFTKITTPNPKPKRNNPTF